MVQSRAQSLFFYTVGKKFNVIIANLGSLDSTMEKHTASWMLLRAESNLPASLFEVEVAGDSKLETEIAAGIWAKK